MCVTCDARLENNTAAVESETDSGRSLSHEAQTVDKDVFNLALPTTRGCVLLSCFQTFHFISSLTSTHSENVQDKENISLCCNESHSRVILSHQGAVVSELFVCPDVYFWNHPLHVARTTRVGAACAQASHRVNNAILELCNVLSAYDTLVCN